MAAIFGKLIGSKEQELLDAARNGKGDVVEKLIYKKGRPATTFAGISRPVKSSLNVNCVDRDGYTALHMATLHGHRSVVEILLAADALPNPQDCSGCTPLHLAAFKGHFEICQLLLANKGIPINVQDNNGDTALHYAAQYGYATVVNLLIQHSTDPAFRNLKQESALDLAAQYGRVEVVSLLVEKFSYLSQRLIPNRSPLHQAAACGHRKIVETLLDAGFDINTTTDNGTALHVAVMYFKPKIVSVLLERGIDLTGVDRNGHTAQDVAAQSGNASMVGQIIQGLSVGGLIEDRKISTEDYIQNLQDIQKAMKLEGDYAIMGDCSPTPRQDQSSPHPRPSPRTTSPPEKVEPLYSKVNKTEQSSEREPRPEKLIDDLPPIPSRSVPLLEEIAKQLPQDNIINDLPMIPFHPASHQPMLSPTQNSPLRERPNHMFPRRPSMPVMLTVPSPPEARESKRPSKERRPSYDDHLHNRYDVEPPPPRACPGDTSSLHVSISIPASPESWYLQSIPAKSKTPPMKPKRTKMGSPGQNRSPQAEQKQLPGQSRRELTPPASRKAEKPITGMEYLASIKPPFEDYIKMSDLTEPVENYIRRKCSSKNLDSIKSKASTEDGKEPANEYMTMDKLKPGNDSDSDSNKDMYRNLDLNRDRISSATSGVRSSRHKSLGENALKLPISSSFSSSSSSDQELSSDSAGDYEVFSRPVRRKSEKDDMLEENIPDIPIPKRPISVQPKTVNEELPDLPKKQRARSSFMTMESCYDKVQREQGPVVPLNNVVRGGNSNCDKSFCDKDGVVREKTLGDLVTSRQTDDLLPEGKRLSNGIYHVKDEETEPFTRTGKLTLEFEKKRLIREPNPLTPTGYPQPATPDFPPPSPNTAMQGIQDKMAGIDSKRSSRDMETITEPVYLQNIVGTNPTNQPTSAVSIPKVDTISGAHDVPFADDVSSISSGGDFGVIRTGDDGGLPSGPSGADHSDGQMTLRDGKTSPVMMRRSVRIVSDHAHPPEGAAEMRRSTGSASSSSQEDLMREDELGPLAGLLRGSVVGRPRRVVSQIWDNVNYRRKLRDKRKSLPATGLMTFDPLMEKEEDVDKKMIESIPATRVSMQKDVDSNSFDDSDDWDQIAGILSSCGEDISQFSDLSSIETEINRLFKGTSKVRCVGDWLEDLNLGQYENTLVANGYDNTDFLGGNLLEEQDLEHIRIKNSEHRKQILDASRQLPAIKSIDPDSPPASVDEWLESLGLETYIDTFKSHKKDSMERVLQLWEVELQTVLDISAIGHRKRILASLGERQLPERQYPSLKKRLDKQPSASDSSSQRFMDVNLYKDYTGVKPLTSSEEDVKESSQSAFPPVDSSEDEDVFRNENRGIKDDSIHLRPPHQSTTTTPVKEWRHPPGMLIKGCCNYTAQYLGSTLVKELCGTNSTIEGICKLKKSAEVIAKIPTIMLSISFRGVKFIDARSKKVICDHEIGNIFCACQDADSMNFFAYITRDKDNHYCHVFSVKDAGLAREIILTLGEAFEVAYQMALKDKASAGALEFDRQISQSDVEPDSISISSKASISTV